MAFDLISKISRQSFVRVSITLLAVIIACLVGWRMWLHYETDPWTRDGRVKADAIQVAPDVTGQIVQVYVRDNQAVSTGQILFEIDRSRFELALQQALATEQSAKITLKQALREAQRNKDLKELVSAEEREQGDSRVEQARSALAHATVNRDTAQLNLDRTRVVSVVNGIVTNLDLQVGTYVTASQPVMVLLDRDSFYIEGYFEETKLPGIRIGDKALVTLTGENKSLDGHVMGISRGIADHDHSTDKNLLKNVNPAFNWVRLVQRIPVRIAIDGVPEDVRLVAGQTATIEIYTAKQQQVVTHSSSESTQNNPNNKTPG